MKTVLITGVCGGVGRGLAAAFGAAGWRVVGTDLPGASGATGTGSGVDQFLPFDLETAACDDAALAGFAADVRVAAGAAPMEVLINNAATQILSGTEAVTLSDWERSLRVNLTAPLRLAQVFLPELMAVNGTIINIGSVHAQATKPGFVAYATTKAAIHGLTRALAVDLGPRVRVLCLAPAAISTPMLRAGFEGNADAFAALATAHPVERIGEPSEVGRAAVALAGEAFSFATGSVFWLDGGVLSRLHDPA